MKRELEMFLLSEIDHIMRSMDEPKNPWYDGVCVGRRRARELRKKHLSFCRRLLAMVYEEEKRDDRNESGSVDGVT